LVVSQPPFTTPSTKYFAKGALLIMSDDSMGFMFAENTEASKVAVESAEEFVRYCQKDQKEEEKAMFPSHTRGDNLKYRYRGEERMKRLRALKKMWDPEGVFTRQFLDV